MRDSTKEKLTYLIITIISGIIYYISGIQSTVNFLLSLIIYTLFFYFIHYLWVKSRKTIIIPFPDFFHYFLWKANIFIVFIILLFGGLSYLSNEKFPAPMPEYTISNGDKTVKFQAMSHIGTQDFYNQVASNIKTYKENGGVYFYEGVKPGTEENSEKFNQAIGVEFDQDLYHNFSKLYGVVNQDNNNFIGLVNNLDFNVDLNMDQIVKSYEEKISTKPVSKGSGSIIPINANRIILETLAELNDKELKILVYINQAILNFIIGNESTQDFLTDKFANKELFDVILLERNKVIVDTINKSKYKNIYMTYGLLHFNGVLELLQEKNSKWKIISTKNLYPIKN